MLPYPSKRIHLGGVVLQLREDLRVDQVQLCLDLVATDVVDGGGLLVQDQVLRTAGEPETHTHT